MPVTLSRIALVGFLAACALVALPSDGFAQGATGRSGGTDPGTKPRPKKTTRPKKIIRARETNDVDKVPTSAVIIRSYPPGAEVLFDGRAVGTTADDGELELSDVRLGPHRIVLKKDGYREWAQTVTVSATDKPEEIEPLLQSESSQFVRDLAKLPAVVLGAAAAGQITRDSGQMRDGSGYYNEYVLRVEDTQPYVIQLTTKGFTPKLRIVDDSNQMYGVERVSETVYQTVYLPHPGYYYLQVVGKIDESTFVAGDYTLTVQEESVAHADHPVTIGQTVDGALEPTDRVNGPNEFYDAWILAGQPGARVAITVDTGGAFTPAISLLKDGRVVGSTTMPAKGKKEKKNAPAEPRVEAVLEAGNYTIYVRSLAGAKLGAYKLSVQTAAEK